MGSLVVVCGGSCLLFTLFFPNLYEPILRNDRSYSGIAWQDDDHLVAVRDSGFYITQDNVWGRDKVDLRGIDVMDVVAEERETLFINHSSNITTVTANGNRGVWCAGSMFVLTDCTTDDGSLTRYANNSDNAGVIYLAHHPVLDLTLVMKEDRIQVYTSEDEFETLSLASGGAIVGAAWHPTEAIVAEVKHNATHVSVHYIGDGRAALLPIQPLRFASSPNRATLLWLDENRIAVADNSLVQVIALEDNAGELPTLAVTDAIMADTLADGQLVIYSDGKIMLLDRSLQPQFEFEIAASTVTQLRVNPTGNRVAVLGDDGDTTRIWVYALAAKVGGTPTGWIVRLIPPVGPTATPRAES